MNVNGMNGVESEPLISTNTRLTENRPLFGDRSTNRERIISLSLFALCGLLLLIAIITLITIKFNAINLITILVILSIVCSHALLIQWYRLGDLDPKFRYLLLWNSVNICVLCVVAIWYYNINKYPNISSKHSLHSHTKCDKNLIPIVFNTKYDIYFFKMENIHPFDTKKWGKIAKSLENYFKSKYPIVSSDNYFVSPSHPITVEELALVHSQSFLCRIHSSPLSVAKASEVCPLILCPMFITERKLLQPIKWQTSGSVLGGFLALKYKWAINLGGGFHHCSATKAQGFCLFADITLTIRYLWTEVKNKINVLIVDCDAHQGNGYARDVLAMSASEQKMVYILDLFNASIYPGDEVAQTAINRAVHLRHKTEDKEYLELLEFHLNASLTDDKFKPDLIIYNAGTDILNGDPLGNLRISAKGIAKRDEIVFRFAKEHDFSVLMLLSGGYQRNNAEVIAESIRNLFEKNIINSIDL